MAAGRTIAVGDVHGCHVALETLLDEIGPTKDDRFVFLGDVIDRGPGTKQAIDRILALRETCRVVHLMGNHEEMFLDALSGGPWSQGWLSYGGLEMLDSYGGGFDSIPAAHLDFIRGGKDYFETESEIYVHGYLRTQIPVEEEQVQWLRWSRFQSAQVVHISGKRVICGHTAQSSGKPSGGSAYLCLDTCAYCPSGALSALDVGTNTLWQATQTGELRESRPLEEVL